MFIKSVICFLCIIFVRCILLKEGGANVEKETWYVQEKYLSWCSFIGFDVVPCTKYRSVEKYKLSCRDGWKAYSFLSSDCSIAICGGKTDDLLFPWEKACNILYNDDYQKIRDKGIVRNSGGTCNDPDNCTNCDTEHGFYSDGSRCRICGKIDHCNHRSCTPNTGPICKWCDGEITEAQYWRAYTRHIDNSTCQKACSWRSDSTRCYPGTCQDELASKCTCSPNFGGTHCENILDLPTITENFCQFEASNGEVVANDGNYIGDDKPIIWTNNPAFKKGYIKMAAFYKVNDTRDTQHYVKNFTVGLVEEKAKLSYYRANGDFVDEQIIEKGCKHKQSIIREEYCPLSIDCPDVDGQICEFNFTFNTKLTNFKNDEKVIVQFSAKNGGYLIVANRDDSPSDSVTQRFYYTGKEKTREFEFHWDTVLPYHCSVSSGTSCPPFVSILSDITNNAVITFTWGGWADDLSKLDHYEYLVFRLQANNQTNKLEDGRSKVTNVENLNISLSESSATVTLPESGMYSIQVTAVDKAGNSKTGRGLVLYDNVSNVTLYKDKTKCVTASEATSYEWVIHDTTTVQVSWSGAFTNIEHDKTDNKWLIEVATYTPNGTSIYEDLYGNRTNKPIDNVQGIVDFKVSYQVHSDNSTLKDSRPLTSISNIHNEYDILTLNWDDGDRLTTTVKALDILKVSNQETITVYRDATPPIIENLWLTIGDRLNVSIHSVQDFTKMTIEWVAFDIHSGLDTVSWKLYDSYGGNNIVHGYEDIVAQGNTTNISHCEDDYANYSRGANCYCTPFFGCFHQHFQIKPAIKTHGGLISDKDQGVHEHDYFIQINVTSKAKLTTILTKKITIDVSPPHAGVVHDGIQGNPEIDYQQGMNLNAYWDQFFDRESGVFFYQYIVGTTCAGKSDFDLNQTLANPDMEETYNTFASHTATSDGTYYFTVVAYNRALDVSEPVCSDGVTIDSSVPGVKEVFVKDSLITGGLVTDTTNYYILGSDRFRKQILDPTADCMSKATVLSDIDLYPIEKYDNGTNKGVEGSAVCSTNAGSPSSIGLTLFKSSLLEMSWEPVDIPAKVYDYEVGFSSTAGSAAPDIMAFESTKQHAHHRVIHTNIPDATRFYIIIKTISKSNVEGLTTLGPCFMDTTAPDVSGTIAVSLSGDLLVATWSAGTFTDSEELFQLNYQFAIGHSEYGTDVQNFKPLVFGGSCTSSYPPVCTVAKVTDLDWYLHGHHTYYVSVKVTNTAGFVKIQTSSPYIHDVQKPTEGVVVDIETTDYSTDVPLKDIQDIDFQTDKTTMAARWSGFAHPHLDVTYRISIGSTKGGSDVISNKDVGSVLSHHETGLSLTPYQKYYLSVTAVTSAGSTTVSSDGVTIVTENDVLSGVMIYDGEPCNMTDLVLVHHEQDNRLFCGDDIDVQMSTRSLKAYWTVLDSMLSYTTDAWIGVEQKSTVGNIWSMFKDFVHLTAVYDVSLDDLTLSSGVTYRIVLKLCAKTISFMTIPTDGVLIMANPPIAGGITVEHLNTTQTGGNEKLVISFDRYYDPDIEDMTERYTAVDRYEFAITDNSQLGKTYMTWTKLGSHTTNGNKISFEYILNGTMDFSRCKRFSLRGYNKVRMYTVVSTEIKDCNAINPVIIQPNIVIDAVGSPEAQDGIGRTIYLEKNALWKNPDKDYTPYKNILSAVWPTLRHRNYRYAIINARSVDVTTYYRQVNQLVLTDPCSHPDSIRCGNTENEFMNEKFEGSEVLTHGIRYTVCVYAPKIFKQHETWIEEMAQVTACSDGIIVDLTPPATGRVWFGSTPSSITYQTTTTDMVVTWDGFYDVEEYNIGPHSTGIKEYIVGIGTTKGGNDVYAFENVGVVQHKAFHGLRLQDGYQYYATLKAVDFADRITIAVSDPVVVDSTPPVTTNNPITMANRHIVSKTEISTCWTGVFSDTDSGVAYYMWSIGSEPGYTDIMPYLKVTEDTECSVTDENNPLDLQDGHYYYINVQAFNKAGLSTLATSWAFQVDTTPPTAGHVYDGDKELMGNVKDVDYQTGTKVLKAYWEGFHDSHSRIQEFFISIGTCPKCEDILPEQAIGIVYDFTLENIHLATGLRYYVTVTACNTAEMCTTATSDGVIIDNSPPLPGSVQDGTEFTDINYQSIRNFISSKWYGFDDPQSGLEKFEWRVGTDKGNDDIVPTTQLHLTETAALSNSSNFYLNLPVNQKIYVTVRAYNKAGLWSESSSNGFVVDTSGPIITKSPTFSEDFGIMGLTQIYRSSMKVEWEVDDSESYIKRQYLSIKSHIGGEFMLSSQFVNGIARSYVFTGLDLHDGVTYYVSLISCNGAEICTTATSSGMFVDSTPPSRGMFAISTDHAADPDLARHSAGWMTWTSYAVYLAWLGFSDLHSGVDHYLVTVGSSYMANDLTKDHTTKYIHVDTNTDHGDEGKVQLHTVKTETLTKHDVLYITIWAVNKVGLRSHLIHSAFNKNPGGSLYLIRRCSSLSCKGHCICAPQDQMCHYSATCTDVTSSVFSSTKYTLLLVKDTNGYSTDDQAVTASDNVLRATWQVSQVNPSKPKWYEWSVGFADRDTPQGFFDPVEDKVWQDAGQLMDTVFTIATGKDLLKNTLVYSVFVRIWYDYNTYAVFKSDGIFVMTQPPALATVRGTAVTEKVQGTTVKDDDYIRIGRPLTFSWTNKFLEAAATIQRFRLYLSTSPGAYDILTIDDVFPGTTSSFNMSGIKLTPGVMHYSNIIAYNYAGAHTTSSSDGFMVDPSSPSAGIVYDGLGLVDQEYKKSTDSVAAHWHGSVDTESGIKMYHWCVGRTTHTHRSYGQTECGIMSWKNVGLHNSASQNISAGIVQGTKMYSKVFATDGVGARSPIFVSDGVIVDVTSPVPEKLVHVDANIAQNPSFEDSGGDEVKWQNVGTTNICGLFDTHHPLSWTPTELTCMAVVSSDVNLAKDGRSFLLIRGSVQQQLIGVTKGHLYRVTFYSSHLSIQNSVAANKEGFVQIGDQQHVFLIYTKSYRHDGHGVAENREDISWHAHTFYFKATKDAANITLGSMDPTTGIFIDDLSVQEVNLTTGHSSGHVLGHIVYLHEWSSIHGSWSFTDPESPITDYSWSIGYVEGGTQIQSFQSTGLLNFAYNNNVTLVHNTYIYVTVVATNAAGLKGVAFSNPILVDLTPPDIKYVYDGQGIDEEAWTYNEVVANWAVEDPESGILICQWAIGYQPGGNALSPFTVVTTHQATMEFPYSVLQGRTIYTTLKCENNAGLTSVKSANGVKISNQKPSVGNAEVQMLPLLATEYNPRDKYQGIANRIKMKWSGFSDDIGIDTFVVSYPTMVTTEKMFFPTVQDVLFADFVNLTLAQKSHNVFIQAVNILYYASDKVVSMTTVDTSVPAVNKNNNLGIGWTGDVVTVSWDTIFSSPQHMFYEVSAGAIPAGVNILQWQETNETSVEFGIPQSVTVISGLPVHVTVKAVSVSGFYAVKTGAFVLP